MIEAAALACPAPVVIWHTPCAVQRTSGYSCNSPGTGISRVTFSAFNQGVASGWYMLTIITLTATAAEAAAAALHAWLPGSAINDSSKVSPRVFMFASWGGVD